MNVVKVMVLFGRKENTLYGENISPEIAGEIATILNTNGFQATCYEFNPDNIKISIKEYNPNVIFNLVYGYTNKGGTIRLSQPDVVKLLETQFDCIAGATSAAQFIVQDKLRTGDLLTEKGYNAPKIIILDNYVEGTPVVLKPRFGSRHVNVRVVNSIIDINSHLEKNSDVLIVEYLPDDEFTTAVYQVDGGTFAFTPIKIQYDSLAECAIMNWPMHTWDYVYDFHDEFNLKQLAVMLFLDFNLKDYARIDFRVKNAIPYVLDINSLPNLDPNISLFPLSGISDGKTYEELIINIVRSTLYNHGSISN
ncbi:hypothetical protein ACTHQF_00255 [Pedobacter sp. SAFR-022]|uniref:hypothetical protein n=1 Tax=Pedobacter sp. SAFR-022 TaxID=3436861 RepID=UPI003F7DF893